MPWGEHRTPCGHELRAQDALAVVERQRAEIADLKRELDRLRPAASTEEPANWVRGHFSRLSEETGAPDLWVCLKCGALVDYGALPLHRLWDHRLARLLYGQSVDA